TITHPCVRPATARQALEPASPPEFSVRGPRSSFTACAANSAFRLNATCAECAVVHGRNSQAVRAWPVIRLSGCMKKLLIALAIPVLLYPVVAWLMGFAIEQRVESLADQGPLMVPQLHLTRKTRHGVLTSDEDSSYELGSKLEVTRHYHRGWYTSVDEATVEMSSAAFDALPALRPAVAAALSGGSERTPFRLSLRTVIHHGPLCGSKCFALAGAET